jgi:cytosine/adenosine deaminase-related metal-dependent hydrolase
MTKTLIKCGWLVTMDPELGDMENAELLYDGDTITAIGRDLGASADETIDASEMIVMPGLVNAHIHSWQPQLRAIGSEWMSPTYMKTIHTMLALHYQAEDNYIGNLMGDLAQIDGGTTTVLDWSHNIRDLEMAERSIDGHEESGIRCVYGHGTVKPPTKPGDRPFSEIPHPRARVEALRKGRLSDDDALVTMALAILGPDYSTWEVTTHDVAMAREFGLLSTSHSGKREASLNPDGYARLAREGLIGPDHNVVHGVYFTDEDVKAVVDCGASITSTCLTEIHHHWPGPVVNRVRKFGGMPSIGIDVEPIVASSMFREMQAALLYLRAQELREAAEDNGNQPEELPVKSREALAWATIGGARALNMEDKIGSLTPGKKADIVMLRATDSNLWPVHNPLYAIVEQAGDGNVDTVIVGGVTRKVGGKSTYPEATRRQRLNELSASAERIMTAAGFEPTRH